MNNRLHARHPRRGIAALYELPSKVLDDRILHLMPPGRVRRTRSARFESDFEVRGSAGYGD